MALHGSGSEAFIRTNKVRFVWVPVMIIAGSAILAAASPPAAFEWVLMPYFAWQFFHFQKQNLGMAALAASAYRAPPLSRPERRTLTATGCAGIAGLVVHPNLLQVTVDAGIGWLFPVCGVFFFGAAALGLALLLRRPVEARPAGFVAMYLISLGFSTPVFLFSSPYAGVGGMTITHGLQYLSLVGMLASAGERGAARWASLALFFNIALMGGDALSVASQLHSSAPVGRALYGAYLGVSMAHFVIDAGIWRLRDAFPRGFISSRLPFLVPPRAIDREPAAA